LKERQPPARKGLWPGGRIARVFFLSPAWQKLYLKVRGRATGWEEFGLRPLEKRPSRSVILLLSVFKALKYYKNSLLRGKYYENENFFGWMLSSYPNTL
jgi:hypothetical protein